jgi:two-component system, cell cycle response regulator
MDPHLIARRVPLGLLDSEPEDFSEDADCAFGSPGIPSLREGFLPTVPLPDSFAIDETIPCFGASQPGPEESTLIRSLDMIFRLYERSEDVRRHMDRIDRILFRARSVGALMEHLTEVLEDDLGLLAARILVREDHPVANSIRSVMPHGGGLLDARLPERAGLLGTEAFVVDEPGGALCRELFGRQANEVQSAAVAPLGQDDALGFLCLGSDDPCRFDGALNTELIAALAEKTAWGLRNAWDHERAATRAVCPDVSGIYAEEFFLEFVHKEFSRAWRSRRPFSLMAVSWTCSEEHERPEESQVREMVCRNVRSSDLVAHGERVPLWVVATEAGPEQAKIAAQRLTEVMAGEFGEGLRLQIGIAGFSREIGSASELLHQARKNLSEARGTVGETIVVRNVALAVRGFGDSPS